jgi:aspartyl-tRNA(Asn)/glutamyl-tRNA(Gln) amidotransferase subunit C
VSAVDTDTVRHVAKLARLTLTDAEVEQFAGELSKILGMVDQLNLADVSAVDTAQVHHDAPIVSRPDDAHVNTARNIILQHAPLTEATYFQVPKILEG